MCRVLDIQKKRNKGKLVRAISDTLSKLSIANQMKGRSLGGGFANF